MRESIRVFCTALIVSAAACVSHPDNDSDSQTAEPGLASVAAARQGPQTYSPVVTPRSRLNHRLRLLLNTRWRKLSHKSGSGLFYLTQSLDLDNDIDEDLLVSYSINPQGTREAYRILETIIFRNVGDDFSMESAGFIVQLNDASVADFNGDGLQDIFVADSGLDAEPFPGAQSRLFLQTTNGKLKDVTKTNVPAFTGYTRAICSGDYDADGDLDVFLASADKKHVIWANDGSGKFADATKTIFPPELADNGTEPEVSFQSCETADFNHDGRDDLALGQQDMGRPEEFIRDNDLVVLRDSHVVLFAGPAGKLITDYSIGLLAVEWDQPADRPQVADMRAADFDQNDCVDLLVASHSDAGQKTSNFAVYFGDCAGAFSAAVDYTISPSVEAANTIHITDFNRDGHPDFVPYYLFDPNPDGGPEAPPVAFKNYEPRAYIFTQSLLDPFAPRPLRLREVEQLPLRPFHGLYHSELPGYTGITR